MALSFCSSHNITNAITQTQTTVHTNKSVYSLRASKMISSRSHINTFTSPADTPLPHTTYQSFEELTRGIDGYLEELSPYTIDASQTIFPQLPTELRYMIYSYFPPTRGFIIDHFKLKALATLPNYAILKINEATRLDFGIYLISTRAFDVYGRDSLYELSDFLETFPGEQGFWAVRRLHFWYLSGGSGLANENFELMRRCLRLRYVFLRFSSTDLIKNWDLTKSNDENWAAVGKLSDLQFLKRDEIIDQYGLTQLLYFRSLDVIVFSVGPAAYWGYFGRAAVTRGTDLIKEVGDWFTEECHKAGKRIQIRCEEK